MKLIMPAGRIMIPLIRVIIFPGLISDRIMIPPDIDNREHSIPRASQELLMVLQNIQHMTLSSGSLRVIGWGVHHRRQ
jgi:hypothetical protein